MNDYVIDLKENIKPILPVSLMQFGNKFVLYVGDTATCWVELKDSDIIQVTVGEEFTEEGGDIRFTLPAEELETSD